jgi:glycosyltransferase involved in cell wall biosynthesis
LPNGIDIEVNHISKNYGKPKKSLRVLFFSNLHPTKGAIDFINACRILKTSGFNYNASIAGNPSKQFNYLEFKKLITAYKLQKHIQYIGPKYGKEKSELFQKSDIFVFPTFYKKECFPLVILEAMAFGLPVISTFEGAIPEIIDNGITGFLVPQKSPFSIAQKIIFLILNEKKRICMGQEARKKYEKYYTIEKFNSNFLEIIDCIFNQKIP